MAVKTEDIKTEYVRHNDDLIKQFTGNKKLKDQSRLADQRLRRYTVATLYGVLFIIGVSFSILLIMWGFSLYSKPKVIKVPVITEKIRDFNPNIIIKNSDPGGMETSVLLKKLQKESESNSNTSGLKVKTNFVVFETVKFSQNGFGDVIIGKQYNPSDLRNPTSQWCYIDKFIGNAVSQRYDLGTKKGMKKYYLTEKSKWKELGSVTNLSLLQRAQQLCIFQ